MEKKEESRRKMVSWKKFMHFYPEEIGAYFLAIRKKVMKNH